ncbi:MAG TPA: hypothetical protein VKK79_09715 [Candidatus Lokiarchaeia archaeon]|nr:hypothetical protein [Candidatus Lokiarchaeia archaeon]
MNWFDSGLVRQEAQVAKGGTGIATAHSNRAQRNTISNSRHRDKHHGPQNIVILLEMALIKSLFLFSH